MRSRQVLYIVPCRERFGLAGARGIAFIRYDTQCVLFLMCNQGVEWRNRTRLLCHLVDGVGRIKRLWLPSAGQGDIIVPGLARGPQALMVSDAVGGVRCR